MKELKGAALTRRIFYLWVVVATLFASVTVSAVDAATPSTPPQDRSWSSSSWEYSNCSFRRGTGEAALYADELCWIDMSEDVSKIRWGNDGFKVTKSLGRYTLSYTLSLQVTDSRQRQKIASGVTASNAIAPEVSTSFYYVDDSSLFGNNIGGVDWFVPESGDPNRPVIKTSHDETWARSYKFVYDQISVVDKTTGQKVPNTRFVVMDAQQTALGTGSEVLTVNETSASPNATAWTRFTPKLSNYSPACSSETSGSNIFAPFASTVRYGITTVGPADWGCYEYNGTVLGPYSRKAGSYLIGSENPTRLEIATHSWSTQAFALAIDMGRMRGDVAADTKQEELATGQATSFDFKMGVRGASYTPAPWQGAVTYTQVIRSGFRYFSSDRQVFSSTATGTQSTQVFDRYEPIWTCTTPTTSSTIKAGSVPAGYTLTNDPATKTSEITAANTMNEPITCSVKWTPKYVAAALSISKKSTGTASGYQEYVDKSYAISYKCVPPHDDTKTDQQAIDEFKTAYPALKLENTKTVKSGDYVEIAGLPAGSTCLITEDAAAKPAPDSGVDHELTWSGGTSTTGGAAGELPSRQVVLQPLGTTEAANPVQATNTYTAHTGTLQIVKTVTGDPVDPVLGSPRTYKFDINCPDADFRRVVDLPLNATGADTLSGNTQLTGVPTGRNCTITPLSGLSDAEQQKVQFDGRILNVDSASDVTANSFGAYPFKIPDYPSGSTPTTTKVDISAQYSWKTASLAVSKVVTGPAAELAKTQYSDFPVRFDCVVPGDETSRKTGTLNVVGDSATPVTIPDVRIGAECKVWEDPIGPSQDVTLDKINVAGSQPSGTENTLSNEQAQQQPVLTVIDSTDPGQNRVVVTNHFNNQVGTVDLTKLVEANGITAGLPPSYEIGYNCGARSVEIGDSIRSVSLRGEVSVAQNGTTKLTFTDPDPAIVSAVTDASGNLLVPYGNTCTFSEARPDITAAGIEWSADASAVKLTVNAPTQSATITNSYQATGDGLRITRYIAENPQMGGPLDYQLTCVNNGAPLALPNDGRFTLSDGESVDFTPTEIPAGSECHLKAEPYTAEEKTRTVNGVTFPVQWIAEASYPSDAAGNESRVKTTSETGALDVPNIVVGEKSVVSITNAYDYVWTTYSANKEVEFPGANSNLISDPRKEDATNREYTVNFACVSPYGETSDSTAKVVDGMTSDRTVTFSSGPIPVGSTCSATEEQSFAANGVTLTQEVAFNGGARTTAQDQGGAGQNFAIGSGDNEFTFYNSYERRVATLQLNKIANTPIDLSDFVDQFHTHTFTMTCVDPVPVDRPVLGTFVGTIHGPGTFTFEGVPVGADCTISGDQFGRLDLQQTLEGRELETHLRPSSVDWALMRNDADTYRDVDLADDATTSMSFAVADGENVVNLTNNYEWVTAKLDFSKAITAMPQELAIVAAGKPQMNFAYRCEGVGYTMGVLGANVDDPSNDSLPNTLTVEMFAEESTNLDGTKSLIYRPKTEVVVPSGAMCQFTETDTQVNAPGMVHTVYINGEQRDSLEQRISENMAPLPAFNFDNRYERELIPVRLQTLKDGFLNEVSPAGYDLAVQCDDGSATSVTVSQSLEEAQTSFTAADPTPGAGGSIVMLPAGAKCQLKLNGASLDPLVTLEVTAGDRRPFLQFGQWQWDAATEAYTAADTNPDIGSSSVSAGDVTAEMKNFALDFTVPTSGEYSAAGDALTIAADIYYPQATAEMTFTKKVEGDIADGATFTFNSNCATNNEFTISGNQTVTLPGVPVTKNCSFVEMEDGIPTAQPILEVQAPGPGLSNVSATNIFESDQASGSHVIHATVDPVTSPSDTTKTGRWYLTAVNKYPSLSITKTIDGSPISSITGAVADTALLPHTADTMTIRYTVNNRGAVDFTDLKLIEPGLAGRIAVLADGTEVTIPSDGAIPDTACQIVGGGLTIGAEQTCELTIKITEPHNQNFTYPKDAGTVTVSAISLAGEISASDSYGAFRPMDSIAWLLPETGMQTLVLVLLLGLIVLGYGLYRWKKERDGEEG